MGKKVRSHDLVPLAVIGGSGVYDLPGLEDVRRVSLRTPFGRTSDRITVGRWAGTRCAFLPRHGRGHRFLPSEVPSRANIFALKLLGAERVVAIGAVGSLKEELAPRHVVIPDQVIDRTHGRPSTFFGGGVTAHVGLEPPFCPDLRPELARAAEEAGAVVHRGGTYLCMEGPGFSTRAESRLHREQGCSVVGMTVSPEYKLAREAGICYATVSLVTDYDTWKEDDTVSVDKVAEVMRDNVDRVRRLTALLLPRLTGPRRCGCSRALSRAVFTDPSAIPPAARAWLDVLRSGPPS